MAKRLKEDAQRDVPFDPLLTLRSEIAKDLGKAIIADIEVSEGRTRKRRANDQATFEAQIHSLIANAIRRHIEEPTGCVSITRKTSLLGQKSRYKTPVMSKRLPDVMDALVSHGWIVSTTGAWEGTFRQGLGKQSTFKASDQLIGRIESLGLRLPDIGHSDDKDCEVIILKPAHKSSKCRSKPMEYGDTYTTIKYREQLQRINSWIADADISISDPVTKSMIDTQQRRLRRVFNNGAFDQGGRLYGGFWIEMSKEARQHIRINGNPVTILDYGQIGPRIMYGLAKVPPHFSDAYSIPGFDPKERKGVKTVFNAMLCAEKGLKGFPPDAKELFKKGRKGKDVISAIREYHKPVVSVFDEGRGLNVNFHESEIMLSVLDRLMGLNIVGLPIHDAIIVEKANAETVSVIMVDAFKSVFGQDIPVTADDV